MTRFRPLLLALLLAGCRHATSAPAVASIISEEPLLPDTVTVDGIPTYTHSAGAFARAPQLTLDTVPFVVFDGGTNGDFDLTGVHQPLLLPDGRLLASMPTGNGRLLLFKADGTPARVLAPSGEGPGDVRSPARPIALTPDTALVLDGSTHRLNWVTADRGIVRSKPLAATVQPFCFQDAALLPGGHLLASDGCLRQAPIDHLTRPPVAVVVMGLDLSAPDTVAELPGYEMVPFETRYRGVKRVSPMVLRFGETSRVAPWDSGFVSATGVGGYVLEKRALDGHVVARIRVNEPRRAVTQAMRDTAIRRGLERVDSHHGEGLVDPEETKREAREVPFADSLPPYGFLFPAPDGILWVVDYTTLDPTWSATAFRPDGAIVARLTGRMKDGTPVWFGKDRVLLRQVDEDGVVKFPFHHLQSG